MYICVYIFTCVIYPFPHCMFIETCFSMLLYHEHAFPRQYTCFTKGHAVTSLTTAPMLGEGLGLVRFMPKGRVRIVMTVVTQTSSGHPALCTHASCRPMTSLWGRCW